MSHQLPHLTWLRAFEATARHLSFTNAAAELNLTQAAVSKQVKLLEHYLREPLFERRARSLVLTKVGAAYLPKVRDAFERLAAGTHEVFGSRRSEVLTIRVSVSLAVTWIAPRLSAFVDAHQGVPVRIVSSVWNEDFDQARFDLDIRYGSGRWPGFRVDRLTWELFEPLCAPGLINRGPSLATPSDLRDHCLLHVIGYEEGWANWLAIAGAQGVNAGQGLQFDTSLMALETAALGLGIALGRTSMTAPMLESGRLVRPFSISVPVREGFYLLSEDNSRAHPHASLVRDWLLGEAEADLNNRRARAALD